MPPVFKFLVVSAHDLLNLFNSNIRKDIMLTNFEFLLGYKVLQCANLTLLRLALIIWKKFHTLFSGVRGQVQLAVFGKRTSISWNAPGGPKFNQEYVVFLYLFLFFSFSFSPCAVNSLSWWFQLNLLEIWVVLNLILQFELFLANH